MSASRESLTRALNSPALRKLRQESKFHDVPAFDEQAAHAEETLRVLTDNIPDRLVLLDPDLKIVFANRGQFDIEREALIGRSMLDFLPESERERVAGILREAISERAPKIYELRHPMRGETRWFENRVGPVIEGRKVKGLTVASSEITARRRSEDALRMLEREITEIANREQRRIGSDLHDGLGQELTGIALMLRGLIGRLERDGHPAAEQAEEIVALVNNSIENTRALAHGLAPVTIERGGLTFALRSLAARASDMYGVRVRFHRKVWPQLTLEASGCNHLYRIAQEAISNAVRHGRAQDITIDLQVRGDMVTLSVSDDGCGFVPTAVLSTGMGLKIMQYRAHMLGGSVTVDTQPGSGTRLRAQCRQVLGLEGVTSNMGGKAPKKRTRRMRE